MGWLTTLRRNHAAKQYALKLPAALAQGWGPSEFYTPAQIQAAAEKCGLNLKFIAIGYGGYLPHDQFEALARQTALGLFYAEARTAFLKYWSPEISFPAWEPIGPSQGIMSGGGLRWK